MIPNLATPATNRTRRGSAALTLTLFLVAACSSDDSTPPAPGEALEPVVTADTTLPGVVVDVTAVRGGSGFGGNFRVGDAIEVDFTVATDAGDPLELSTFARGAAMVSGPTFNYARVIASQSDVIAASTKRDVGAYTYRLPVTLPATYLAPLNDTPSLTDGEMTGEALLAGTYTVALELRKDYTVDGTTWRDPGNGSRDFLFGSALTLAPREVVTRENCNSCHGDLSVHGDNRTEMANCLVCHTAGAEDGNDVTAGGGTPGVSIEFKVLIHKIHAGAHLPSVNGVTTDANGYRNYNATPTPYVVQGYRASLHDYSEIGFPVWPSLYTPMPRDEGYSSLPPALQAIDNTLRSAPVACHKCHGDPDGDGPLPAPAQGDLAYSQPTRRACASCHDDWIPELPYRANGQHMPPQHDDVDCKYCHDIGRYALDVDIAHRHPLVDPDQTLGVTFDITSVTDVGDGDGKFETGERVQITMTIKDRDGNDVPATSLNRIEAVLSGPTANPNLVNYSIMPAAGLGAGPTYTFRLPQTYYYEPLGGSTTTPNETFPTLYAPHWNVSGAATSLLLRAGATTAVTTLAADAPARQNFVDLPTGQGTNFAADDYVALEFFVSARREYLKVQYVDGDRLWFSSAYSKSYAPGLNFAHANGSSIDKITVAEIPTADWSLDPTTGVITEVNEWGSGEVLATYTSDFEVPADYPGTFNDSPDLDQGAGDWVGLPLLAGTYQLGVYGRRGFAVTVEGESTSYSEASEPEIVPLLFGDATAVETSARLEGSASCYACHQDIQFHGGIRRGVETCLLCHGLAGAEDAPVYVYPSAAPTTGVTIDFRSMLHKIHHGKELAAGANYVVNGFGGSGHSYEHVGFPIMPNGTKDCTSCHGAGNTAWEEPADREHPNAVLPTRKWAAACASCHDANATLGHIAGNTTASGFESCDVCHGEGRTYEARAAHLRR